MQKTVRGRRPHGIRSRKISVSVSRDDLAVLAARAKRLHRGNLSAVVHEMVAALRRQEAADRLLEMLGGDRVTEADIDAIRKEMDGVPAEARRRRRRGAA
jgi:hypothetical protein